MNNRPRNKKIAYVIGPYRADNEWDIIKNVHTAEHVAIQLWNAGFAVICPHKNSNGLPGAIDEEVLMGGDYEFLAVSDFVVTCGDWQNSKGSLNELKFCKQYSIPVYYAVHAAVANERNK